jgi:hypothetical protein
MPRLFVLAVVALLPFPVWAQTAKSVIDNYLHARGGLEKIKAIQSERVTGTISFGPGADGPFVVERMRPLKMHMEITVSGQNIIRSYDGKSTGWVYNPFAPNPAVEAMSEKDVRNVFDEADFEGPFIDSKAKGNQIEYVGKREVEGKPTYELKLTNRNGDVSQFFFDASTFLLLKWQGNRKVGDKEIPWESYFRDYREVEGVLYPFLIDSDAPGSDQSQKIVADKIEVNIPIDESHFGKPNPPAPPEPPAEPAKPN